MGPGELWERIFTGPGMIFFLKIPVGKDPGNLQVHPCSALPISPFIHTRENTPLSSWASTPGFPTPTPH